MADDDSTIYIDVAARLDERSADEVEGKLRGKLSHVGDSLKDSLSGALDSLGDHLGGPGGLGDKLHDAISGAFSSRELDNLGQRAGTALGQGVGGALKDITQGNFGNVLGEFKSVGDVLSGALNKLSTKLDGLEKAGDSIGNVLSGEGSGDDATNILDGLKGLGVKLPGSVDSAVKGKELLDKLNEHPGQAEDWLDQTFGFALNPLQDALTRGPQQLGESIRNKFTGGSGPSSQIPSDWRLEDEFAASNPNAEIGSPIGNAGSISAQVGTMDVAATTVMLGGNISLPAGLTTGPGSGPGGASGVPGSRSSSIAGAGSAGIPSAGPSRAGGSLGSAGSFNGLGFSGGGVIPGDSPGYDNILGYAGGGGPVGLEGGEYVVNPQATQQNMGLLNQINSGGPNFNEQNSNGPKDQEQMGYGQGFGLTGTGAIGLAESLPGMLGTAAASGAGGFGAGAGAGAGAAVAQALWQNIGQPELNEAIKKGGQIAAAAALAPIETGWLSGGQMGAETVGSPAKAGWTGKLLGGLLGSQFSMPNIAGAVQPPKDPKQGEQDQGQDQDPGAAGKQAGAKGAKGGGSGGPLGTPDDPHNVKIVGGQQQPPMGANQSGSSVTSVGSALGH